MALINFSGRVRKEGVTNSGKRSVDVTNLAIVAADTLDAASLGLSQIDEVWFKVPTTGTVKVPIVTPAVAAGTIRIVGS